jgi:hypothetical protein
MGEVLLNSLGRLRRDEGMKIDATEAADRMEHLHREHRVRLPDYASNLGPIEKYGDPRASKETV